MDRRRVLFGAVATGALGILGSRPAFAEDYRALSWPDLLPPGEVESLAKQSVLAFRRGPAHGSFDDVGPRNAIQPGTFKTVKALDGLKVRLKGYVVPLDFAAGKASTFLLVPYFGACIHAPPPPPNQTILARTRQPIVTFSLNAAVEARGVLTVSTNSSEMGDSAYLLELDSLTKL